MLLAYHLGVSCMLQSSHYREISPPNGGSYQAHFLCSPFCHPIQNLSKFFKKKQYTERERVSTTHAPVS